MSNPFWQKQIDKINWKRSIFSNRFVFWRRLIKCGFLLITIRFLKTDYVLLDYVSTLWKLNHKSFALHSTFKAFLEEISNDTGDPWVTQFWDRKVKDQEGARSQVKTPSVSKRGPEQKKLTREQIVVTRICFVVTNCSFIIVTSKILHIIFVTFTVQCCYTAHCGAVYCNRSCLWVCDSP